MYNASALFKQYIAQHDRQFEIRATIGATIYDHKSVIEFNIDDSIIPSEDFTIGTVITSRLNISIKTNDIIPTNAKIFPEVKLKGSGGDTEWVPLGNFYIDTRQYQNNVWKFVCYDKLIVTEQPFVSALNYPNTMQAAFDELVGQLGLLVDASVVIDPTYQIPYKDEDITIREMLGYIASAHGASVKLTRDEKIKFVKYNSSTVNQDILASGYFHAEQTNPVKTYTKIKMVYNTDGEFLTSGVGEPDATMTFYNPFMTQAMLDTIFAELNNLTYVPYTMSWKGNPELDCGDVVSITLRDGSTITSRVLTNKMYFKGGLKSVFTAPSMSEQQSEFNYKGMLRKLKSVSSGLQEDTPYYGVTIGRTHGLKIEKSDGSARAIFNADILQMEAGGVPKLYFDPAKGTYIFDGLLSADAIEAVSANIDVVISNTVIVNNLYSEYGRIANLTVSELNTGWQKITNFLANNKAPVFYKRDYEQYSMYYEAVTDGTEDPNTLTDRDGNLLYWVDNTYKGMTLANTGLPVKTYKYTEYLKMEISFRDVDGVTRPRIIMGAGYGNPSFPERGKFIIDKHVDGGLLEYITANGTRYSIEIGENGILQNGVELLSAIDFYSNGFTATYGGTIAGYRWTKDGTGKIMQLTNIHTSETVPVTWGGGPL